MFGLKSKLFGLLLICGFASSSVYGMTPVGRAFANLGKKDGLKAAFAKGCFGKMFGLEVPTSCPTINNFASREFASFVNGLVVLPYEIWSATTCEDKAFCTLFCFLMVAFSQVSVEIFSELWSRWKKTMPDKQSPGFFGFCKDVFKRSICIGKDGLLSRSTPQKLFAKVFVYRMILKLINNQAIDRPVFDFEIFF